MRKLSFIVIMYMLFTGMVNGQQIPFYSQYYFNPFIYNPAMTGSGDQANVFVIHRSQWAGIPGAPLTNALTLNGPVKDKKIGLGLSLYNDVTDIINKIGAYSSYSYRVNITDRSILMLGLSIGVLDSKMDFSKVVAKDIDDQTLFNQIERKSVFDANFGAAYLWKKLEIGIAVPQILASPLKYARQNTTYNLSRHYLLSAKYEFNISEKKNISLYPLVLMRVASGTPVQYDVNAVLNWKNIGWISVTYRSDYAVGLNARIKLYNKFSVGYSYELITSAWGTYAGTSHEIMLGYTFGGAVSSGFEEIIEIIEYNEAEIDSLLSKLKETEKHLKRSKAEKPPSQLSAELAEISKEFEAYKEEIDDSINKLLFKSIIDQESKKGDNIGFITKTSQSEYFTDESGKEAAKGYYLVISSFKNWDRNAETLRKDYTNKGYKIVYNKIRKWNYVYISKPDSFKQALEELKKARNSEFSTAWIHILK